MPSLNYKTREMPAVQRLKWKTIDRIIGYTVGSEHQPMCLQGDASGRTNKAPYTPFMGVCREWRAATMAYVHNLDTLNTESAESLDTQPRMCNKPKTMFRGHCPLMLPNTRSHI
ncbi:hypothetical protein IW139_002096 [Coemansia sp. RSA 353]|nr:hypothetical protein IW142_002093 [Coemansia sp. RSA 564]KAJ2172929.1 hypothetical protein GGH16_002092 [Coemansia sp. RSA 560]KAJ2188876.1 hypothetical protein EV181_001956 [Coemansia sp. RSA 532]KAJ2192823.1 hypothetical protein GGH18_002761 [Coemansia sp. RSA 530]KAJ2197487.1 hypothetical protein IW144_002390 [Coemansia sp. RSA 522]KAJ2219719.1 hypothetical protein IW143_002564 [Coemansia sp. RSA 520]KAJ2280999.1 hypothetical protein GGH14_002148 [Coemansia sp. RSA 370]KAJ2298773.1 hyp